MSNSNYKYKDGIIKIRIGGSWVEPRFSHYSNLEPIGEPGANGVVIKGTHTVTGRTEAIKIWLPRDKNGENEIRKDQYLQEVQKIAQLKDSRIVTIHNAWEENGCYCSSMEYIDGVTYKSWLETTHNMSKRIHMLLKIFEAIFFYHSQGIIHGDIHSKNILVGKNNEIHIIDFGTSIISSYKDQSKHRENFLMYELVEKTLENQFDHNVFLYKKYHLLGDIKENDIRNVVPICFSKSVLCYLHLLIMLACRKDIINTPEYLYEYCSYIAKGFYINMDYFYHTVPGECENKLEKFTNAMFASLEEEMFGECQDNPIEIDKLEFLSLFAYFEEVKRGLLTGRVEDKIVGKHLNDKQISNSQTIINIISETNDLLEFHDRLTKIIDDQEEIYLIETELRGALYNIMKETYGGYFLHILRYLYFRIEEVKRQKELCDRIIKLSPVYCFNNGISTPRDRNSSA